ncbi:MAG: outer membrane beta-barrel protein [Acidobacteria bacterium]|nr:outer membrane beta-barrel protein [Acidobacteriota bacterium]MCI0725004.1 outer membrane beta-barrel protein [Acidobacteriota bacterium]
MNIAPVRRIASGLLTLSLLVPQGLLAQTVSTEQLMETIKKLEARIAELESKSGTPAPGASAAAQPSVAELKKEVDEVKKQQEEAAPTLSFFKTTQLTGYVDSYYGYNVNRPADQSIGFRGTNFNHNSFQFSAAKLSFNRPTSGPNSLGYRLDLVYGPLADSFNVPFELPVDGRSRDSIQRNILNAYVSYTAPVGNGLTFDVGKFTTFIGAEVFDTIDNWNYQQGVLFSYAQPFYHTGLRMSYAASDKVGLGFYLVNGWNNSFDQNTGKSVGFSLTLTPSSKFQIIQNYLGGPENSIFNDGWRHLYDGVINATINPNVALRFNYDIGTNRPLISSDPNQSWRAIASSIRFSSSNGKVALAPRFEYLYDDSGFATGYRQDLKTFTLTNEYRIKSNFSTKLEYRYDFSNEDIFKKRTDEFTNRQNVFLVGLVYSFGIGKE